MVLVVDKPVGPTSFAVVRQVRHAAGVRRVGHGGTLDPLASGVLPVCLGEATKLAPFLLGADKEYEVTIRFGVETDTDDADGAVTSTRDASAVSAELVRDALAQFRGAIEQVPPAYAAIKRDGRPLYAYARAGEVIEVAPRPVVIHALELLHFGGPEDARLHVHCSKGTYVRALARDLGRRLGVGGHVTALRRTRSGPFSLLQARPLPEILEALGRQAQSAESSSELLLVSLSAALRFLPQHRVDEALARDLRAGKRVAWETATAGSTDPRVCLLDPAGDLIAVAEPRPDKLVKTLRVFGAATPADKPTAGPANSKTSQETAKKPS
ncbi:MAG TPA: tRNA pseudouridine(55) synthase TruB [Polyangia bacterium]|nr:tRNA pseudouridine(55) synthase TruB [Polyangia bacterium]